MALRYVCFVSTIAVAVLAGVSTKGYAENSPPGQHTFSWLRGVRSTRKPVAISKAFKPPAQSTPSSSPTRDTQAVTLANQALSALTGGSSITTAVVQGNANFTAGSDQESGTATLEASVGYESRVTLSLSGGQRTVVRNGSGSPPQGKSAGPDATWQTTALHNCWTDPTWFFPAISLESALNDSQIAFTYIGTETKAGVAVQHFQTSRVVPGQIASATQLIQQLSTTDIYLDASTYLPVAIDFNTHPSKDAMRNLPVEIRFTGWHVVGGIQTPSEIQKFVQNTLELDLSISTITVNTSIPAADFAI